MDNIKQLDTKAGTCDVYISKPKKEGRYPGLIVIHEIWGVNEHIKDVADRYAGEGFDVAAPDLFGDTGIVEKMSPAIFADMQIPEKRLEAQARMREIMKPIAAPEFSGHALAKLEACFEYLKSDPSCTGTIGVLGFCFGGTYSFLLATKEPRLKAAVVFYGQPPELLDEVAHISCPVLALHGGKDERLMKTLPQIKTAMKRYSKDYEEKIYPDAGHAFFNDTNIPAYNEAAAKDAWKMTLAFLRGSLS